MPLRALILGVGNAFTDASFGSCCAIEADGGFVLVDCPDPIHRVLREGAMASGWGLAAERVTDVILTHLHGDHCNGIEGLGFHRWLHARAGKDPVPRLHVPEEVAHRVWERLAPAMDRGGEGKLSCYFDLRPIPSGGTVSVGGLSVHTHAGRHSVPAIGLCIRGRGGVLGWSGDTAYDPEHVAWLDQADIIVHECSPPPFHTALEDLEGLPARIRDKLRLIHLPNGFDASSTALRVLRQGEVIEAGL